MSIFGVLNSGLQGLESLFGFGKAPKAATSTQNFAGGMNRNKAALAGNFDEALKSYKKGGKVKKTGIYKLHKGEYVVPTTGFDAFKKRKEIAKKMRHR